MDTYLKVIIACIALGLTVGLVMPVILYMYWGRPDMAYLSIKSFIVGTVVSYLFFRLMYRLRGE